MFGLTHRTKWGWHWVSVSINALSWAVNELPSVTSFFFERDLVCEFGTGFQRYRSEVSE